MKRVLLPIIAGAFMSSVASAGVTIPTGHVLIGTQVVPALESSVTIKMLNDEGFRIVSNMLFIKAKDHTVSISLYDLQGKNRFQIKQILKDAFKAEIADALLEKFAQDSIEEVINEVANDLPAEVLEEIEEKLEEINVPDEVVEEISQEVIDNTIMHIAEEVSRALIKVNNLPEKSANNIGNNFADNLNNYVEKGAYDINKAVELANTSFSHIGVKTSIQK